MLRTLARAALAGRPPLPRAAAARLYAAPPGSTLAEGAETEEDEWAVLVVSAKKDTTKVRAKQREALLAAAEAKGWLA